MSIPTVHFPGGRGARPVAGGYRIGLFGANASQADSEVDVDRTRPGDPPVPTLPPGEARRLNRAVARKG